jgi:hypothetical protein
VVIDLERRTQPGDKLVVPARQVRTFELLLSLHREGMQAHAEQRLHLLRSHLIPGLHTVDAGQPRADPYTRCLTTLGVVAGEWNAAFFGRIQGRHLPGQVVVPRPSGQLVDAHRHASQKTASPRWRSPSTAARPGMKEVCRT